MKIEETRFTIFVLILMMFIAIQVIANDNKSPVDIIKTRNEAVDEILAGTNGEISAEKKEQLKEIINGIIDFQELSRLSLGKYWKERSEQEKVDFINVFSQLIKNSSVKKLEVYEADRLVYEEPEISGTKAKVTTVAYKKRKQIEVIYKMHKVKDQWLVYDMEIDGVSTARNYRDSFYKQIAKNSYEEMYNKLVKRLKEQEN